LIKADGGTASVAGFDVVEQPSRVREQISVTGQFAAVDDLLTARENLVLADRPLGQGRRKGQSLAECAHALPRTPATPARLRQK
jgi:ABC-2 type transport system ATP-binding protein